MDSKRYECYFYIKTAGFTLPFFDGSKLPITRYVQPRLKLGVNVSYDQVKVSGSKTEVSRDPHPPYDSFTTTYKQSNKEGWLFFGPQLGYDYLQTDNFRLGSLVGVSMMLNNREDIVDSSIS